MKDELVDDLADVLVRMTVGWKDRLGVDLHQHPDLRRVMARYRNERTEPDTDPRALTVAGVLWNDRHLVVTLVRKCGLRTCGNIFTTRILDRRYCCPRHKARAKEARNRKARRRATVLRAIQSYTDLYRYEPPKRATATARRGTRTFAGGVEEDWG